MSVRVVEPGTGHANPWNEGAEPVTFLHTVEPSNPFVRAYVATRNRRGDVAFFHASVARRSPSSRARPYKDPSRRHLNRSGT